MKPAYEQAYKSAESMGVSPSIYGQYAAAKRQQEAQFNRMGMGQSGAAMAAGQGLTNQYMDAVQQAQAQANQDRYNAFSNLANSAYGYGAGATGMWQNAAEQFNQQAASRQIQRDQQRAAEQAGTGQLIGGVADLGLALATGGASVPFQAMSGGLGGMFGGGGQQPYTQGGVPTTQYAPSPYQGYLF